VTEAGHAVEVKPVWWNQPHLDMATSASHLEGLLQAAIVLGTVDLQQRVAQEVGTPPNVQDEEWAGRATHERLMASRADSSSIREQCCHDGAQPYNTGGIKGKSG